MGRTANRRAVNSANRSLWLSSVTSGLTSGGANAGRPEAMNDFPPLSPEQQAEHDKIMRDYEEQRRCAIEAWERDFAKRIKP